MADKNAARDGLAGGLVLDTLSGSSLRGARATKQSSPRLKFLDCFASLAMTIELICF